ncbi:MAG: hypothetical protein ABEN55_01910, partial [Bradymonadaceae bacterium]
MRQTCTALGLLTAASILLGACAGNKSGKDGIAYEKPKVTTTQKDGYTVQHFDLDGEGDYDVVKYIESYQDP